MKILTKQQVLALHSALVGRFGGTDGVRDMGVLESALAAPFQTFGGEPLCPSLLAKAARLGFGLVSNHPFLDGNKRIGAHAMLVFLALNGVRPVYTQRELIELILSAARSEADSETMLQWLLEHKE
ncbi:MAG: type II toxin-antitoxin system death-on-curing family toxin [Oscillospiraceae bacterium]|nr:type II toxin-antitoxin system death-on-curing family toxin [Oscillospiraceae bacterium]